MVKHVIKESFQSSVTPEELQKLPKWRRYWSIYDLINKQKVKYLRVDAVEHLHLFFTLNEGKYLIQNGIDRYILEVGFTGEFTVKELNQKIDKTEYLFTD